MRTLLGLAFLLGVVGCGSSSRSGSDASGPEDATGDARPGGVCGGPSRAECPKTQYCDYADNGCGVGDRTGTCVARPDACPLFVGRPACACDGNVYTSECIAYNSGFDLNAHGTCTLAAGQFACGYTVCDLQTQYCRHDARSNPDAYLCLSLPAGCTSGTVACACLASEPCGTACAGDAKVGLTLSCQ